MCGWSITSLLLISSFYLLCYNVISIKGLKVTLPLCLLSFLHNRIPCKHIAWVADNLVPLDMLFYLLQLNTISLTSPKITLALFLQLLFVKMDFYFYFLRKTGPAKTRAAGPFPLAVIYIFIVTTKFCLIHNEYNRTHTCYMLLKIESVGRLF